MTFTFLHCNCLAVCSNISVAFRQPDQQHIQQTLLKTNFWVGFYSDDCIENDTYICLCRLVRNTLGGQGGRVIKGLLGSPAKSPTTFLVFTKMLVEVGMDDPPPTPCGKNSHFFPFSLICLQNDHSGTQNKINLK